MTGYYKNPEATARVLVDGWLKTGDLGSLLPDGHLQITGRAKDVIVLASGKNIYPDELEGYYEQSVPLPEPQCECVLSRTSVSGPAHLPGTSPPRP